VRRACDGEDREPRPPPRAVPDAVAASALPALLAPRFAGVALGDEVPEGARAVVWVDGADEVVVHLDSVHVSIADRVVLVGIDLETDQTGRATLVVPFAVGGAGDDALVLTTEERPRGPAELVARWGSAVRDAAYAAVIGIVQEHADERGMLPAGLSTEGGSLRLRAEGP
jgi:hypothetical protein